MEKKLSKKKNPNKKISPEQNKFPRKRKSEKIIKKIHRKKMCIK